jgi:hypothetical protein
MEREGQIESVEDRLFEGGGVGPSSDGLVWRRARLFRNPDTCGLRVSRARASRLVWISPLMSEEDRSAQWLRNSLLHSERR